MIHYAIKRTCPREIIEEFCQLVFGNFAENILASQYDELTFSTETNAQRERCIRVSRLCNSPPPPVLLPKKFDIYTVHHIRGGHGSEVMWRGKNGWGADMWHVWAKIGHAKNALARHYGYNSDCLPALSYSIVEVKLVASGVEHEHSPVITDSRRLTAHKYATVNPSLKKVWD